MNKGRHSKELSRRARYTRGAVGAVAGLVIGAGGAYAFAPHGGKTPAASVVTPSPERGIQPPNTDRRIEQLGAQLVSFADLAQQAGALPVHRSLGGRLIDFTLQLRNGTVEYGVRYNHARGAGSPPRGVNMLSETVGTGKTSQTLVLVRQARGAWGESIINSDGTEEDVRWVDGRAEDVHETNGSPTTTERRPGKVAADFRGILGIISYNVGIVQTAQRQLEEQLANPPVPPALVDHSGAPAAAVLAA